MRAPVGGLFRHVLDLAGEQASNGHQVGILADSTTGDRLTDDRLEALRPRLALGITRTAMSRRPGPGDIGVVRFTAALAERLGADILHGHGAKGGAFARLAGRSLKSTGRRLATFYTPHGGSLNYSPGSLEGRLSLGLEKVLHRITDGLVFESAYAAEVYARKVANGAVPARVVPNGLQPADFVTHATVPGASDFLFIGELREAKGIDVLLAALARVNTQRPARATLIGSGRDLERLKSLAADLGLGDLVSFPGPMPARDAFPLGRTLVVPSRAESFPYIVLEAGAAGMPLITTGVGGIPEMLAGTDTPMLAAGDVEALAARMIEALDSEALLRARAARFKAVVGERYTVAGMTRAIVDFYADRLG